MQTLLETGNVNMPKGSDSLNIWQVRITNGYLCTSSYQYLSVTKGHDPALPR